MNKNEQNLLNKLNKMLNELEGISNSKEFSDYVNSTYEWTFQGLTHNLDHQVDKSRMNTIICNLEDIINSIKE